VKFPIYVPFQTIMKFYYFYFNFWRGEDGVLRVRADIFLECHASKAKF